MKKHYPGNLPSSIGRLVTLAALAGLPCAAQPAERGLPAESRAQIHALFDGHAGIRREVKLTPEGYTALTESDDPQVSAALKKHVKQMRSRLDQGLAVRRWDPAFAEYVRHYADLEHDYAETDKGVRMTVKGRTATAVLVAQNHAKVVSFFAVHGWQEHGQRHDPVVR